MKSKISKKFLALIISASLLVITGIVLACTGGEDFSDFYNSFFAPETSNTPESKPFYRSVQNFYSSDYYRDAVHIMDSTNIDEWKTFFADKVKTKDLNSIVYKSSIGEIDTCIFFLRNNTFPIKSDLKNNSLLAFDDKALSKEFLFYLGFAKRCEPFTTYAPGWWTYENTIDPRNDKEAMEKLLVGGKKSMTVTKSPFIKERYAFQNTRLLYQTGLYEECINFYNQNLNLFTSKNTIVYRAMGYVAASNYKLKNFSQANYLYSIIFDQCEAMKKISFMSFHPQEESDWEGSLALAKNTHEKEVLWHLLGIYVDPLRAMQEIYKLNPKSNLLDLLLVRAVNINEEYFIKNQDYWSKPESGYALRTEKVDNNLLNFSQKVANEGNSNKPYLWNLAAGYLNLAQGSYKQSEKYLSKAESTSKGDELVSEQIRAFRIMSRIEQYTKPESRTEGELTKELIWLGKESHNPSLRSGCIHSWALSRLSEKYRNWGDLVKAQCLDYTQNKLFYDNQENINSLIALIDKPNKTDFEKFIVGLHPYSRSTLFTYKAIILIYQYKFQEALEMIDACPQAGNGGLQANPFIIHINDCHDCDFHLENNEVFSQYTFVQRLLELQNKAISDPKNAAQYYFLLANGLYNMTYYGNAHDVFSSPILGLSVGYIYSGEQKSPRYKPYFDCAKALEYYNKAMEASTDKEFKAKCCFMAAKCEQNQYYSSDEFSYKASIRSGVYFKQLRETYSKTKYYQEIIRECGYFRKYIGVKQ